MLFLILFVAFVAFLAVKYPDRAVGTPRFRKLPGPRGLPIIGNLISVLFKHNSGENTLNQFLYLYNTYGPIWTVSVPGLGRVMSIDHPATLEFVLKTNYDDFVKGSYFHDRVHELLGTGIFAADGDAWKMQRKTASKIFGVRNFRDMICREFFDQGQVVLRVLSTAADSGELVDLQNLFFRFTMDSFGKVCFSKSFNCLTNPSSNEFAAAFDYCQKMVEHRFINPFWRLSEWFSGRGRQYREAIKILDAYTYDIIRQRREQNSDVQQGRDLLDLFMNVEKENDDGTSGGRLSDKELRDVVLNFMLAGRDTTAEALSWMFYLICKHPAVESRLLDEINAIIGDKPAPTYDDTKHLKYMNAVVLETLRLYPSVPKAAKIAIRDCVFPDGTYVPAGTVLSYHHHALGHSKSQWGNTVEDFDPQRFLDGNGEVRKFSQFVYPVFNAGPRVCLGQQFAMTEILTLASMVLKNFRVEPQLSGEPIPARSLTLPMSEPFNCRIHRR